MKTYTYKIQGGGSSYDLLVHAESEEEAQAQVEGIKARGSSATLLSKAPGTLDDYLGPKFFARIASKIKSMKMVGAWRKEKKASPKAGPTGDKT